MKKLLLAVSGGIDSVVLAHLMDRAHFSFAIAHANFGLRGSASEDDQALVHNLAHHYKVPFHTKKFDTITYKKVHKLSIQMAARTLRYEWMREVCTKKGYVAIATAHHHNDVIETLLFNLIKGTGIAGLRGILPRQDSLIRPLLYATKEDILDYSIAHQLKWREDSSNNSLQYARNQLRHQIIPQLKALNPNLENTFKNTISKLQGVASFFHDHQEKLKPLIWHKEAPYIRLELQPLIGKPWAPIVLFSWLEPFGFSFPAIQRWWTHPPQVGRQLTTTTHWLLAERKSWVLGKKEAIHLETPLYLSADMNYLFFQGGKLTTQLFSYVNYTLTSSSTIAALDKNRLTFPLTLRKWQPGDVFCPLGMKHHKKVSDFLIDTKIPHHLKKHIYVLTTNKQIVWVIGHRIDDRFKCTPATQTIYELTYKTP